MNIDGYETKLVTVEANEANITEETRGEEESSEEEAEGNSEGQSASGGNSGGYPADFQEAALARPRKPGLARR